MKRCLDCLTSLIGLLLLAPLLISIAVWARLREGSPVFFRQYRVGRSGRPFLIWKFRTMVVSKSGSPITVATDPRITPTGRLLRKWKLDELPQLLNVIDGTMSLVGPRPEVPEFVDLANPVWQEVLTVRPGITDWATLMHFNEEKDLAKVTNVEHHYRQHDLPFKLRECLCYVRNRSFKIDLKILWLTILLLMRLYFVSLPQNR